MFAAHPASILFTSGRPRFRAVPGGRASVSRGERPDWSAKEAMGYDHRLSYRSDVDIPAEVRESGAGRFQISVLDLSQSGFRMRSLTYINPEKKIFLTLPGFAPLESEIAWNDGELYGCRFCKPLYPAVFDHICAKFPALR